MSLTRPGGCEDTLSSPTEASPCCGNGRETLRPWLGPLTGCTFASGVVALGISGLASLWATVGGQSANNWRNAIVQSVQAHDAVELGCSTAVQGEACFDAVYWAMQEGIHSHPEWYEGLGNTSSFEDFQKHLHRAGKGECREPCPHSAADSSGAALSSRNQGNCHDAIPGESCYDAVRWARSDGVYGHPERYPGLNARSSFQEFQAVLARRDPGSRCPPPCMLAYPVSSEVRYRSQPKPVIKGVAYGPSPEMRRGHRIPNDDFMSEQAAPMWASWGRGDLATMRQLGANTVRLYGNDPRTDKRGFLDEAFRQGVDVIIGMSNYPYVQARDSCQKRGFDCRRHIYETYKQNLLNGLTINNGTAYHPAVKAVIVVNEPDLILQHSTGDCKAVVSAFDGMLQAERELGVAGNPVAFTVTYSIATPYGAGASGQMNHLHWCMMDPRRRAHYAPLGDVTRAYRTRWVHGYNTPEGVGPQYGLLGRYSGSQMWRKDRIPVFIGEFHAPDSNPMYDLPAMLRPAQDGHHPYFLGFAFFEFQARYDKTGGFGPAVEMKFGVYGLDRHCVMGDMPFFGKTYPVHRIVPRGSMEHALRKAFGGPGLVHEPCRHFAQTAAHAGANSKDLKRSP